MTKVILTAIGISGISAGLALSGAQDPAARYRVDVDLVALTLSVRDSGGAAVHGLAAADVRILEDGIPQRIAAFAEGSRRPAEAAPAGTSIFILFDTSDPMYRSIPYVCDAIAEFLRHLDPADSAAIYTFSKNLFRAVPLTRDRLAARAGLAQNVSVGDNTALFNGLLLTLRDAARVPGRKTVVAFSNGPDTASMLSPEDVGTVAEDEGIPVYIVSTADAARDRPFCAALERLTYRTGGRLYIARNWQAQARAFAAIQDEIGSSYTAYYYPAPNTNLGFRSIKIEIASPAGRKYSVRARRGYVPGRPSPGRTN